MTVAKGPEVRREELLEAAEGLFAERGYERTKVADIIGRVGVAKGTFYYYFHSKEEVLKAVSRRYWDDFEARISSFVDDPSLDPLGKIGRIVVEGTLFGKDRLSVLSTLGDEHGTVHDRLVEEGLERMVPLLSGIVEDGRRRGCFDTDHPRRAVEFLFTASDLLSDPGLVSEDMEALADFHDRILGAERGTFSRIFGDLRAGLDRRRRADSDIFTDVRT